MLGHHLRCCPNIWIDWLVIVIMVMCQVYMVYVESCIAALTRWRNISTSSHPLHSLCCIILFQHSPDGVTRVLLVTYMRGGSSVLGEAFNHNPDAFYWFEPLDGLYSDLYGTMHGWMPIDILYHKNKTMR